MKRFNDLTSSQKSDAVNYVFSQLKELTQKGDIEIYFPKTPNDVTLLDYAVSAAEDSFYTEAGKILEERIA